MMENRTTIFDSFDQYKTDNGVQLSFTGENLKDITIHVMFACTDGGTPFANVSCYDLPSFTGALFAGYKVCNELNCDELVKYYIDEDDDAVSHGVLVFDEDNYAADLVLQLATMTAFSVDESYPKLLMAKLQA
jgi:hypothetical protein